MLSLEQVNAGEFPDDYLKPPRCPVCGRECDTLYLEEPSGELIGCENCVRAKRP